MTIKFDDFHDFIDLLEQLEHYDILFTTETRFIFINHLQEYLRRIKNHELLSDPSLSKGWKDIDNVIKRVAEAINRNFIRVFNIKRSDLEVLLIATHLQMNYQGGE